MAATTMVTQIRFRPGLKVAVSLDGQTGNVTMNIQDPKCRRGMALPDGLAKPFVDMFLHRNDLQRALAFVGEFDEQGVHPPGPISTINQGSAMRVVAEALWLAALGPTMKCFQFSEAREMLLAETVFGEHTDIRSAYDVLKHVRNRHVLHDENGWTQAAHCALLADDGHDRPDIDDINCVVLEGTDYAHVTQLRAVVIHACAWIDREIERHTDAIRADLQSRPYSDLAALPDPAPGNLPTPQSAGKKRRK